MKKYQDRAEAGRVLAQALLAYKQAKNTIVLGLPRGGIPIAYEIAQQLSLPLDVFIVRKLGVPGYEELAMGALTMDDNVVFNQNILHEFDLNPAIIKQVIALEKKELARRTRVYRGNRPLPNLSGQTIILVDDGIATGATLRAAIMALQSHQPHRLIAAVPVASSTAYQTIASLVDEVVCPMIPAEFSAVGEWYIHFPQTEDQEVIQLLKQANIPH